MGLFDILALRHYQIVRKSGLFDHQYYRKIGGLDGNKTYPPLAHFLLKGGAAEHNPHPLFESGWYLNQNPDVKTRRMNPLVHYLRHGAKEGRDPNPYFDTKWYLAQYKDVAKASWNPLIHYLKHGAAEGRDPSPKFKTSAYLRQYRDVADSGINPLAHFLEYGKAEGRVSGPGAILISSILNITARSDGCLEFTTDDPQLYLSFATQFYMNQLCLWLSLQMITVEGDHLEPRLYVDYGDGLSEAHAFYLARTGKNRWRALLPVPCLIKTLRLDPAFRRGVIRPPEIFVQPVDLTSFLELLLSDDDANESLTKTVRRFAKSAALGSQKEPDSGLPSARLTVGATLRAVARSLNPSVSTDQQNYLEWIEKYDTITESDVSAMAAMLPSLKFTPLISVVLPVYNTKHGLLKQAIESILAQTYPYLELCIADDASTDPEIRNIILNAAQRDKRVKYIFRSTNGHIAACSNSALSLASGDFVALVDHDDVIPIHALWTVAFYINRYPGFQVLFSDEDKIDEDGSRQSPYFKGNFDEYLLYGHNMVSHLGVYRRSLIEELGGFRQGYDGSQDYDLILRCFEKCGPKDIVHIPHILYHWRMTSGSASVGEKDYTIGAAQRAIDDLFARRGLPFRSINGRSPGLTAIEMPNAEETVRERVSLLIPTRDGGDRLAACINSINKREHPNIEVIVVNNGSKDKKTIEYLRQLRERGHAKVLEYDEEYNYSKINNFAVAHSSGTILCFLNDDTEVVSSSWLARARTLLSLPAVGAVGARLLYPNGALQHFGVHLGIGHHLVAGIPHAGLHGSHPGYYGKAILMQQFSAVTAACMFMRRDDFIRVGGFEPELTVAYGDVDLCLKVRESGLQIVCDPDIELIHHESMTRGLDITATKRQRLDRESEWMRRKWGKTLDADPFVNPNLDLMRDDFALAFPPRQMLPWRQGRGLEQARETGLPAAMAAVKS